MKNKVLLIPHTEENSKIDNLSTNKTKLIYESDS